MAANDGAVEEGNWPNFADPDFQSLVAFYLRDQASLARCGRDAKFEWPLSDAVKGRLPLGTQTGTIVGKQKVTDLLYMSTVPPGKVLAEVGLWVNQVSKHLNNPSKDSRMRSANKELRAMVLPMRDDELVMGKEQLGEHGKGHCWTIAMSSRCQLTRRMYTVDHPRTVPFHFTVPGVSGNKVYAYHVLAFAAAWISEINPGLLQDATPPLIDLQQCTRGKTGLSNVLRHKCGQMWCLWPGHMEVGTKQVNDTEEHCHYWLRVCHDMTKFREWRMNWCQLFHAQPGGEESCWTNVYDQEMLNDKRLSLAEAPADEVEEEAGLTVVT